MNLAVIRREYSPTGGAELYLQRLMPAMIDKGHQVHLYTENWSQAPIGVQVHVIEAHGNRSRRPVDFAQQVDSTLRRAQHDCVFSLERTLRQDVYRAGDGVHRVWLEQRRRFAPAWKSALVGRGGFHRNMQDLEAHTLDPNNTSRILINSAMVGRQIESHCAYPPHRMHLIRNGVDVDQFRSGRRLETRRRWGIGEEDYLLLFVGSGWERKGLRFILQTMKKYPLPGTKLLVAGADRRPWITPSNVQFTGPVCAVQDLYAAADLFVFLPIYEPAANVCTEALVAGLPVVTCAFNGAAEDILENQTGTVLSRPDDLQAIAAARSPP